MNSQSGHTGSLLLWILPLTVFAFSAPAVNYLNLVFTTNTRWLALVLLFLTIAVRADVFSIFQTAAGVTALLYSGWCIATALWSEVPALSTMKAGSLIVLMIAMFAAGQMWMRMVPVKDAITYSLPMAALALFSGLAGHASVSSQVELGSGLVVYQGLTSNPNMFGSILAMGLPILVWGSYLAWKEGRKLSIWSVSVVIVLAFLIISKSRASLLVALMIFGGFIMTLRPRRRLAVIAASASAILVTLVVAPGVQDQASLYLKKGGNSVLFSREQVWAESYSKAVAGGLIGAGYGVTVGQQIFELGLTSFGYGREKGNSQLAIAEETGLVGLAMYFIFLATVSAAILRGIRISPDLDTRIMFGIMGGSWAGMFVNSVFEAWWVAPGSPEAVWFWSLTGVIIAAVQRLQAGTPREPRTMPRHGPARTAT